MTSPQKSSAWHFFIAAGYVPAVIPGWSGWFPSGSGPENPAIEQKIAVELA
jgi:hypothetical protein